MDIKDVKVGDRCWCQWINGTRTDENGQNATVTAVDSYIHCCPDDHTYSNSWKVSVESFFWTKPIAPPKPKRKVTRYGWVNLYHSDPKDPIDRYLGHVYDTEERALNMRLPRHITTIKAYWEEEE